MMMFSNVLASMTVTQRSYQRYEGMNPQKDMLILRNDVFWEDSMCEPEDYACGKAELCLTKRM